MRLIVERKYFYDDKNRLVKKEMYNNELLLGKITYVYGNNVRTSILETVGGFVYTLEELDDKGNPISLYLASNKDLSDAAVANRKKYIYDNKDRIYKEFTSIGDSDTDKSVITYYYRGNNLVKSEEIILEGEKGTATHEYERLNDIEIERIKEFSGNEIELVHMLNSNGNAVMTTNFKNKEYAKYKYDKNGNLINEYVYSNNENSILA